MMNQWTLTYHDWDPDKQPLREALCTLGNGLFATRGAAEEVSENEYNYPGTYMAGGYNRLTSKIAGKDIENEDLVNWPNWLSLTFRIEDGPWFDLEQVEVLEYLQELNIQQGVLQRKMKFRDKQQRVTSLFSVRLMNMCNPHEAAIEWELIPENWSGDITFRSGIDGSPQNNGVARYSDLEGNHTRVEDKGKTGDNICFLSSRTVQSEIKVSMACRTKLFLQEEEAETNRAEVNKKQFAGEDIRLNCRKLMPVKVVKTVAMFSSRDPAISDPLNEACKQVRSSLGFSSIREESRRAWSEIWKRSDICIKDDKLMEYQQILRLHIFHLYQTVSVNSMDYDIGVPSRGWHGEAYRGHIFWDELFIFPYLILHDPQLARSLLMYRYRRLEKARSEAAKAGFKGCMYPWQSGSNGREESQVIHLNPKSGHWIPDHTHLQRHINSAIAYNVWQYYQSTKDIEFLLTYGTEIIFNIALFWSSIAEMNPERNRYEIRGVVGPDEYHTHYPGSDSPGLNNNAYTNFMAVWVIKRALEITELLDDESLEKHKKKIGFEQEDMERWKDIISAMYIPITKDGLIMQFDGFDHLEELDWDHYHEKYGETLRLDRILEGEDDTVNRYQACKQADVLMLFYLFSSEELVDIFRGLDYEFQPDQIVDNIKYYQAIASHGSTLSRIIYSWVMARSQRNESWDEFTRAIKMDVDDEQGGTTSEGIHLGAMAGTVDMMIRGYSGMEIRDNILWFKPRLPVEVDHISFQLRYRSHWIGIHITHSEMRIDFDQGWADPVEICVRKEKTTFKKDQSRVFKLE